MIRDSMSEAVRRKDINSLSSFVLPSPFPPFRNDRRETPQWARSAYASEPHYYSCLLIVDNKFLIIKYISFLHSFGSHGLRSSAPIVAPTSCNDYNVENLFLMVFPKPFSEP